MPFVDARDGTPLFFNDVGSGRPVVLLHGWPLNGDMWEYQSVPLAEAGFRVVTPDRRGFGRSGQPWSGYDYDTFTDDVEALLEARDLRDAVVVGFSMAGGEVARLLGRDNGRVAKAVLVAAVTPYLEKAGDNEDGVDGSIFDGMLSGIRADRPEFLTAFGKAFYGHSLLGGVAVSTGVQQWTLMMAMQAAPRATYECINAFGRTDFRADLRRASKPLLVIHGTADQTVPIDASARRIPSLAPGATLVEYEGAPHGLFITERERLARDLIDFARG